MINSMERGIPIRVFRAMTLLSADGREMCEEFMAEPMVTHVTHHVTSVVLKIIYFHHACYKLYPNLHLSMGWAQVYGYQGLFIIHSCKEERVGRNQRLRLTFRLVKDADEPLLPLAKNSGFRVGSQVPKNRCMLDPAFHTGPRWPDSHTA